MSRRANGTNRAAMLVSGSRYTGYARPKKKAVSLAELNGRLVKKLQLQFTRGEGEKQDTNTRDALAKHVDEPDKKQEDGVAIRDSIGREQNPTVINESGLYALIFGSRLESAKRFKRWVTAEVLPAIRKTGTYTASLTTEQQIQILAQGNVNLANRIEGVENKVESLENDMPLYSCEVDEIQGHVKRKAVKVLGGKDSEAYQDASLRASVFKDMYGQLKREYGCVASYKSIKRRYIADVHEFIDGYELPTVLSEQVQHANAQLSMAV